MISFRLLTHFLKNLVNLNEAQNLQDAFSNTNRNMSVFFKLQLPIYHEPRHEKTYLCHMRTTKAQISLRISAA